MKQSKLVDALKIVSIEINNIFTTKIIALTDQVYQPAQNEFALCLATIS
jgi:hypothetical protein